MKKTARRILAAAMGTAIALLSVTGCGTSAIRGKRIVRIGHVQPMDHPSNIALLAFEEFIEGKLGDKYNVEVYPSELLGAQTDMVQLTQTGAIDFCIASNAILETFSTDYTLFNLPYLFRSTEAYHKSMEDDSITKDIFASTRRAGFEGVTWLDAGTRNFYTVSRPIETPADLRGLKIRVQQSPSNVEMMQLFGGSATPMGFGEVYTALQSRIIDGAENNELALTANGHGDVCKYYSYDMHQMIPDILIGNCDFLNSLSAEERAVFDEGFELVNQIHQDKWEEAIAAAKDKAENEQGVQFNYPDVELFQDVCEPMHQELLDKYPDMKPVYDAIQKYNAEYASDEEGGNKDE